MIGRRQLAVASPVSLKGILTSVVDSARGSSQVATIAREVVARTFSASEVVLTDSGTSALVLAMRITAGKDGVVGLPAYACVDLAAAALAAGVRVRLYDVDPATLSPDLDSVGRMISRGVSAIVVAHLFGYPADVPAVQELAAREGVRVIEDAAQGAGGSLHHRRLGALGELAVLSFGRGKGLCAGGGGALLARGERWQSVIGELSLAPASRGWGGLASTFVQWVLGRPSIYWLPSMLPWLHLGEMVYHSAREPAEISAASASMVPTAISLEPADVAERRMRAKRFDALVDAGGKVSRPAPIAGGEPSYLRYPIRDTSGRHVPEERIGIVRPYPEPWIRWSQVSSIVEAGEPASPGASELASSLMTLPTHRFVTDADVAAIGRWLAH
jgi:perosamine synthetase